MWRRRKARRAGSPAVICPDGASRAGTYCLIDATICGYSNGHEPKPAELLASLRGQRMKAIKNLNQLNFVTEALSEAAESSLAR
jgi:protein tyrosine phosphatase